MFYRSFSGKFKEFKSVCQKVGINEVALNKAPPKTYFDHSKMETVTTNGISADLMKIFTVPETTHTFAVSFYEGESTHILVSFKEKGEITRARYDDLNQFRKHFNAFVNKAAQTENISGQGIYSLFKELIINNGQKVHVKTLAETFKELGDVLKKKAELQEAYQEMSKKLSEGHKALQQALKEESKRLGIEEIQEKLEAAFDELAVFEENLNHQLKLSEGMNKHSEMGREINRLADIEKKLFLAPGVFTKSTRKEKMERHKRWQLTEEERDRLLSKFKNKN